MPYTTSYGTHGKGTSKVIEDYPWTGMAVSDVLGRKETITRGLVCGLRETWKMALNDTDRVRCKDFLFRVGLQVKYGHVTVPMKSGRLDSRRVADDREHDENSSQNVVDDGWHGAEKIIVPCVRRVVILADPTQAYPARVISGPQRKRVVSFICLSDELQHAPRTRRQQAKARC